MDTLLKVLNHFVHKPQQGFDRPVLPHPAKAWSAAGALHTTGVTAVAISRSSPALVLFMQ